MRKAAIITVGDEIMEGLIEDTNASYISRFLVSHGLLPFKRLSVADRIDEIHAALSFCEDCDLVLLSGGLGPTEDDITRIALASYIQKELVFNAQIWQDIQVFFEKRQLTCSETNKVQAMVIEGGGYIDNALGTAPGLFYHDLKHSFILIPGPPRENRPMLEEKLPALLKEWGMLGSNLHKECLRLYGLGESQFTELSKDIIKNAYWGTYFSSEGYLDLHLSQWSESKEVPIELLEEITIVKELLDKHQIIYTEKKDLARILLETLSARSLTISFAESLTGGLIGSELVKWSGASESFLGTVTSYSNQSKVELLSVPQEIIDDNGAVSESCVEYMAQGAKVRFKSDIAVAVSGIAGPKGGSLEKPVGIVHFAFIIGDQKFSFKKIFRGDRNRIIIQTKNEAFLGLYTYLKNQIV